MRVTVMTIAVLVGLLGLPASIAGEITVFLVRQNVDQNLQQDDVVKPNTRVQTRDGGLVVLVESEMVTMATEDRKGLECLYWTVIPANTTHIAKSAKGRGCENDLGTLDRALASAESGEGQLMNAAFRVVHPPALVRGDQDASDSQKAAYRFAAALREIPLDPPKPRGPRDVPSQPRIHAQVIEMKIDNKADASRIAAEAARSAALEKEESAKAAEGKKKEKGMRAAREAEERRRELVKAVKPPRGGTSPLDRIDPNTASSGVKVAIAMEMIKGTSIADLSEKTGLRARTIEDWHRRFVAGGQASLEGTVPSECEEAISELREKLGEMLMENGRLRGRCG